MSEEVESKVMTEEIVRVHFYLPITPKHAFSNSIFFTLSPRSICVSYAPIPRVVPL